MLKNDFFERGNQRGKLKSRFRKPLEWGWNGNTDGWCKHTVDVCYIHTYCIFMPPRRGCLSVRPLPVTKTCRGFPQIWNKRPLRLQDVVLRFCWSKVKGQCHWDLVASHSRECDNSIYNHLREFLQGCTRCWWSKVKISVTSQNMFYVSTFYIQKVKGRLYCDIMI